LEGHSVTALVHYNAFFVLVSVLAWHWDRFFSELSVFPRQFHSTGAPLLVKLGKKTANLHHRVAQKAF
jgi:hypothetical protein